MIQVTPICDRRPLNLTCYPIFSNLPLAAPFIDIFTDFKCFPSQPP